MNFKKVFGSFFKSKRNLRYLSKLELNIRQDIGKLDDFGDVRLRKSEILKNTNPKNIIRTRKNKKLLYELCTHGLQVVIEEERIAKGEDFLINFLENKTNNSKIQGFLESNFSSEEKELFQNLSRNKSVLDNLRQLHKRILDNLSNLKISLEQQINIIKRRNFFSLESIHEFNILLEGESSNFYQLLNNLTKELRVILSTHSLPFSTIDKTPIYESDANYMDTFKRLLLVHLTDNFPHKGVIRSSLSENQGIFYHSESRRFPTFSTVHFTLNGPAEDVSGFLGPSWKEKKIAIIIPGYNFPKRRIVHFGNLDTFVEGNVKIPPDSYIITCKEIFSSEEEYVKINNEFFGLGIRIVIVDKNRVYDEVLAFCKRVKRYSKFPAIIDRDKLMKIAESFDASYSYDQYDAETISRNFTSEQNEIYRLINSIRSNLWNNKSLQDDDLLLNAEIIFRSLMVTYDSFLLINKNYNDERFYKPIAVLLNLIDSLVNLISIFITNEIDNLKNKSKSDIEDRIEQLTKNISTMELTLYLNHEMRKFKPDLDYNIRRNFNKTLINIQSKTKLMQEFCNYFEICL